MSEIAVAVIGMASALIVAMIDWKVSNVGH